MRVVLDTNIIVSGLVFNGNERRILELANMGKFHSFSSSFILEETAGVLVRKFGWPARQVEAALGRFRRSVILVEPSNRGSVIQRKPSDNRILECVLAAQADVLVTGDRRDLRTRRAVGGGHGVGDLPRDRTRDR